MKQYFTHNNTYTLHNSHKLMHDTTLPPYGPSGGYTGAYSDWSHGFQEQPGWRTLFARHTSLSYEQGYAALKRALLTTRVFAYDTVNATKLHYYASLPNDIGFERDLYTDYYGNEYICKIKPYATYSDYFAGNYVDINNWGNAQRSFWPRVDADAKYFRFYGYLQLIGLNNYTYRIIFPTGFNATNNDFIFHSTDYYAASHLPKQYFDIYGTISPEHDEYFLPMIERIEDTVVPEASFSDYFNYSGSYDSMLSASHYSLGEFNAVAW